RRGIRSVRHRAFEPVAVAGVVVVRVLVDRPWVGLYGPDLRFPGCHLPRSELVLPCADAQPARLSDTVGGALLARLRVEESTGSHGERRAFDDRPDARRDRATVRGCQFSPPVRRVALAPRREGPEALARPIDAHEAAQARPNALRPCFGVALGEATVSV